MICLDININNIKNIIDIHKRDGPRLRGMAQDWDALAALTAGRSFVVERVRRDDGVAIEGVFELPPLVHLAAEDQVFVAVFVRSHGSIKQMEEYFGVSYPTIKNRLNRIGAQLNVVEVQPRTTPSAVDVLEGIERGTMS